KCPLLRVFHDEGGPRFLQVGHHRIGEVGQCLAGRSAHLVRGPFAAAGDDLNVVPPLLAEGPHAHDLGPDQFAPAHDPVAGQVVRGGLCGGFQVCPGVELEVPVDGVDVAGVDDAALVVEDPPLAGSVKCPADVGVGVVDVVTEHGAEHFPQIVD